MEEMHRCEVCVRLDKDETLKECKFCSFCNAWLCEKDVNDPIRRAKAFGHKVRERITELKGRPRMQGMYVERK